MAKYRAYAEYKDSGLEWLGEIPSHWKIASLRFLVEAVSNGSTASQVEESETTVPISRIESISTGEIDMNKVGFVDIKTISQNFKLHKNDILLSHINSLPMVGNIALKRDDSTLFHGMNLLRLVPNRTITAPYYLFWLLKSIYFRKSVESVAKPAINQASVSIDSLKNIKLLVPNIDEQIAIANFLDHETAKIDHLIEKQQQLIELLKEKRQAVISHAVTKGLNPNVPMKDSGVEWLGEVPEHWILSNLKYFASIQGGYAFNSDLFVEEGTQVLRIGNVYQNTLSLDRQPIYISNELVKNFKDFIVSKNDVLMSLTGTLGKRDYGFAIKVKTDEKYLLNQRVAKISPNPSKIDTDFMVYVLWSESYLTQLYSLPSGTKQANLSNSDVLGIQIVVPPSLEEQKDIAKYLKNKLLKFDDMILKAESAISLMQERRTALISAAVTGKIDVRNWQAPSVTEADTELSA